MIDLIRNEVTKTLYKRKLILISVILLALILLFSYGENYMYKNTIKKYTATSGQTQNLQWQSLVKQQMSDLKTKLNSPYIQESGKNSINIQIQQLQYYLDNNINPITPSASKFTVTFMEQSVFTFLPLLIIILAADIVSAEFSTKTIKVLLTRAVPRWKILLSKYISLLILTTIVILETALIAILVSGMFFHNFGWNEPVATGFKIISGKLDGSNVIKVFQWQYLILVYSLAWFVAIAVGTISFMISVLVKSTTTSIGIMMATLIGGQFLQLFLSDWPAVKYFFVLNLNLPKYLTGSYQPTAGMNLIFSVLVLIAWSIAALIISFRVFTKQDVLV